MTRISDVLRMRLAYQGIRAPLHDDVAATVGHLLAVQAQDHYASLWAVGMRTRGASEGDVEQAIRERRIVRSWPMRGTLHLLAAQDLRWMQRLLATRVMALDAKRIERDHGLDARAIDHCRDVVGKLLQGGHVLSRPALYAGLSQAGIDVAGPRGLQILGRLAHEGWICQGPREGKQPTFVLVDDWLPAQAALDRDEALCTLAERYVRGHGPATVRDLAWWSGLTLRDAQHAWDLARPNFSFINCDGVEYAFIERDLPPTKPAIYWLPAFDEYLVGYQDREAMIPSAQLRRVVGANGLFNPTVIVDGRVVGTWKRTLGKSTVTLALSPLDTLSATQTKAIARAAQSYGRFLGLPVQLQN